MKPIPQSLLSPLGNNLLAVTKPETKTKQKISEGGKKEKQSQQSYILGFPFKMNQKRHISPLGIKRRHA